MEKKNVYILGGGLSGIALALHLNDRFNVVVLEKNKDIGGLCRSYKYDNVCLDYGPHICFSKDKEILSELLSFVETNELERKNKIDFEGCLIEYPFENGLVGLPQEIRNVCLATLKNNPYYGYNCHNMEQVFISKFGEVIAHKYLIPYNQKVWKFNPAFMDVSLVERIPDPSKQEIEDIVKGKKTTGYKHQALFHYPIKGGIQSLIKGMYKKIRDEKGNIQILIDQKITSIDLNNPDERTIKTQDFSYELTKEDIIVNTIPLPELFYSIGMASVEVKKAVKGLRYNSAYIVLAEEKIKDDIFCIYNAGDDLHHRLCNVKFLGKNYQHKTKNLVNYEITFSPEEKEHYEQAIEQSYGVLKKKYIKYAYPIHDINRVENMSIISDFLADFLGVYLLGRFGAWEYKNMDMVYKDAKLLAEEINTNR